MKMDIGVSTACLYPLETEKALYELAKRGVKNVEIFVNSIDELEGQVLVELRRIIGEYGMNVISMHPFSSPMETLFLFGDYPRRTEYLIDIYKRYFEVMAEIGADVFVLHGAILSSKVPGTLSASVPPRKRIRCYGGTGKHLLLQEQQCKIYREYDRTTRRRGQICCRSQTGKKEQCRSVQASGYNR